MTLAKPAAPKGIGLALGEDRLAKHPVKREEARIPTCRDDRELIAGAGGRIHLLKIFRDLRVRIKTIDGDEAPCELRPLLRRVGRRDAREEEDVSLDLLLMERVDANERGAGLHSERGRVAARIGAPEREIRARLDGADRGASKVPISGNCD